MRIRPVCETGTFDEGLKEDSVGVLSVDHHFRNCWVRRPAGSLDCIRGASLAPLQYIS